MSFAKAKIQRFNDIKDCSPSPAKYNVAIHNKIKHGILSQTERFIKKSGSPPNSESGSVQSTPCFQTPTVPKKKKFFGLSSSKTKSVDLEELKEKIVECNNKDAYIKELTEQMEEMKEKMCNLEKNKLQLEDDKDRFIADIEQLEKTVCDLQKEKQELQKDKEKLTGDINEAQINYRRMSLKHTKEVEMVNNDVLKIKQVYEDLKNENFVELSKVLDYINKLAEINNDLIEETKHELEEKSKKHAEEISLLKQHQEAEKREFENKIKSLESDLRENEDKIKLLQENFKEVNLLAEIQMKEKIGEIEECWKLKLQEKEKESEAILKECQEISEYSIIQTELEKNHFKNLLSQKESDFDELKLKYNEFVEKFDIVQKNLDEANEAVSLIKKEKHAYEISIALFNDTIEVLKKRLINSDGDVEQLKEELTENEKRILEYEKKIGDLTSELTQLHVDFEELEMQGESTSKMLIQKVKEVERALLNKVQELELIIQNDKHVLDDVLEQLHEQRDVTTQAQELIENSNALIDQLENDCKILESRNVEYELEIQKLQTSLEEETEESCEIRKKYIDKSGKYDELSHQFEQLLQELDDLKMKNCELESLVGPFQLQLEAYDEELRILKNEKDVYEDKANELTAKYGDILSHQNHKQKIKHVFELTKKSTELLQQNVELETKNMKLNKAIEKLRKENEELKKSGKKLKVASDKENVLSPGAKTLIRVESPGPLREKN